MRTLFELGDFVFAVIDTLVLSLSSSMLYATT